MFMPRRFLAAALGVAVLAALPAHAELTARQVIDEWVGFLAGFDQRLSWEGERVLDGALELTGVSLTADIPGDKPGAAPIGQTVISTEVLRAEQVAPDRVVITTAPDWDILITMEPDGPGKGVLEITGRIANEGLELEVSGSSVDRRYVQTLERMILTIDRAVARGIKGESDAERAIPLLLRVVAESTEATFSVIQRGPDTFEIGGHSNTGRFTVDGRIADPEDPLNFMRLKQEVDGLEVGMSATLVPVQEGDNPFARGLAADVDYRVGPSSMSFEFANDGQTFATTAESDESRLSARASRLGTAFGLRSENAAITMRGSDIPLPEVAFGYDLIDLGFELPFAAPDVPVSFDARLIVESLRLSDMIWSVFDPQAKLPHDPATARIRLAGTARWLVDALAADPEAAMRSLEGQEAPLQIDRIEISEILLSAAGARIDASGAFTFDNTDLQTFDGVPRPEGRAQARASGLRGLVEKLVEMGLVPDEAALTFGGLLGAFTRPTDEPDTVTSEMEISPQGQISVNGMQIGR